MPSKADRPLSNRFFPATRIGLLVGLCVGIGGAVWKKSEPAPGQIVDVIPTHAAQTTWSPTPLSAPVRGPVVVNVWLEGCADCMPAFEAWSEIAATHALDDVPVMNVAYGHASEEFARKYRVDRSVVIDRGEYVVNRFGIGTFTTLVLDRAGNERSRASPVVPGYVERVKSAYNAILNEERARLR
jgi:thiol-disulfide isomerase/thioredoxin